MLLGLKTLASFLVETRRTRRKHLLYIVSPLSVQTALYVVEFCSPECAVHVVDIDTTKLLRQLRRGEKFQFVEEFILGLVVLAIVASCVDEQSERSVPQAAGDLFLCQYDDQHWANSSVTGNSMKSCQGNLVYTHLQVAVYQSIIINILVINVPQDDADDGQAILKQNVSRQPWLIRKVSDVFLEPTLLSPPSYTALAVTNDSVLRNALRSMKFWNRE